MNARRREGYQHHDSCYIKEENVVELENGSEGRRILCNP